MSDGTLEPLDYLNIKKGYNAKSLAITKRLLEEINISLENIHDENFAITFFLDNLSEKINEEPGEKDIALDLIAKITQKNIEIFKLVNEINKLRGLIE